MLPDPQATPGATWPGLTQDNMGTTICAHYGGTCGNSDGWTTSSIRPASSYTTALKVSQLAATGAYSAFAAVWGSATTAYEEDHLIPLAIGGNPTSALNLWPQPYNTGGATHNSQLKDTLEGHLQDLVCTRVVPLAEAQTLIASNWTAAYAKYIGMSMGSCGSG